MDPIIVDCIKLLGYENTHYKTKRLIVVKTPNSNREAALKHISSYLNAFYDSTPCYLSSIGYVKFDDIKIIAKPVEKQGDGSAGKLNEQFLIKKLIRFIVENPKGKILFQSDKQNVLIEDVTNLQDVSKIVNKKRHKTDIKIRTLSGHFNISVKKQNAEIWESADSYAGGLVKLYVDHLIEKELISMNVVNGVNVVYPNIAIECSQEESDSVIFGSDIDGCGAIVINTFIEEDFSIIDDMLVVNCAQIIRNIDDLKEYQKPYFLIRNDCTRNCGYKGIRVLACYKSRINGNMITFPVSQRID